MPNCWFSMFERHSQSAVGKRREERQLCLLADDPSDFADLSGCELTALPQLFVTEVSLLQKKHVDLHSNYLVTLCRPEELLAFHLITWLDVSNNRLKRLPEEIGNLKLLQVIRTEKNRLKVLPDSFAQLQCLTTVNISHNRFKAFPVPLAKCGQLRNLDIRGNELDSLDADLCRLPGLSELLLDEDSFIYPTPDVCKSGLLAMLSFMSERTGIPLPERSDFAVDEVDLAMRRPPRYENMSQGDATRIQEELRFQQAQEVAAREALSDSDRRLVAHLETSLRGEDAAVADILRREDCERRRVLDEVLLEDRHAQASVEGILARCDKTTLRAELNAARAAEAQLMNRLRTEQTEDLRRAEVMEAMEAELVRLSYKSQEQRDDRLLEVLNKLSRDESNTVSQCIGRLQEERDHVLAGVLADEEVQKELFRNSLVEADSATISIMQHIKMVEDELTRLTSMEMRQSEHRNKEHMTMAEENRRQLTDTLSQLMKEEARRQYELSQLVEGLEADRDKHETNMWLHKYQELMKSKPQRMAAVEESVDERVLQVLRETNTLNYIWLFAEQHIDFDKLLLITDEDLRQFGVHEASTRQRILDRAYQMEKTKKLLQAPQQPHLPSAPSSARETPEPSAPPSEDVSRQMSPEPPISARATVECVVCLDESVNIIFLPCGHVCTCASCSAPLSDCPMCRSVINSKVQLRMP